MKVLFVCSMNRWRSPTAEAVFAKYDGVECESAGVSHDAENPVTPELLEWADTICVMEKAHRSKLQARFGRYLKNKRVVCLDIPDKFVYMDPELVAILESKSGRFLR